MAMIIDVATNQSIQVAIHRMSQQHAIAHIFCKKLTVLRTSIMACMYQHVCA